MHFKKWTLTNFGRALAGVVSVAFVLVLAGCSQSTQGGDTLTTGQGAAAAEKPVATTAAPLSGLQPITPTPMETAITQTDDPAPSPQASGESAIASPYAGQENRKIKALSTADVDGLLAGAGTPFGGMAKPAELNGYPGPRHVLDAVEAGEFEVSVQQLDEIEYLYESMRFDAIGIGKEIIEMETTVDDAFGKRSISAELLQESIFESARLYGQLRLTHLETHLSMVDILTPDQVKQYNMLRGYTSGNACDNVPEGHSGELWKQHNNCS